MLLCIAFLKEEETKNRSSARRKLQRMNSEKRIENNKRNEEYIGNWIQALE